VNKKKNKNKEAATYYEGCGYDERQYISCQKIKRNKNVESFRNSLLEKARNNMSRRKSRNIKIQK